MSKQDSAYPIEDSRGVVEYGMTKLEAVASNYLAHNSHTTSASPKKDLVQEVRHAVRIAEMLLDELDGDADVSVNR